MSKSISVTNIPIIALVSILVSLIFVTGCTTTITQNYEHKISMSKDEAVQTIIRDLNLGRSIKDVFVDETGISFTYRKTIVDSQTFIDKPLFSYTSTLLTKYHYEYYPKRLVFVDVVMIKKFSSNLFLLCNNKGEELCGNDCQIWTRGDADKFASALLRLCPNVGPASSNVTLAPLIVKEIDTDDFTNLKAAVHQGDLNDVKSILSKKPQLLNSVNDNGVSLLHVAAVNGYRNIAEFLIDKGAAVNARTLGYIGGDTPLHCAATSHKQGCREVAELLIAKGAEINAKNYHGKTPLHWAAMGGNKDIAELLIAKGADINTKNSYGTTPLESAIYCKQKELADLLRQHGAR